MKAFGFAEGSHHIVCLKAVAETLTWDQHSEVPQALPISADPSYALLTVVSMGLSSGT